MAAGGNGEVSSRRGEAACSVVLALVGLWLAALSRRMPWFEDGVPGPGLAPAALGIALAALGFGIAAAALLRRDDRRLLLLDRDTGLAIALMVAAVAAFEHVGYLVVTFAFLLACFVWIGREPWLRAALVSAAATLFTWALFAKALGVQLPAGLTGRVPGLG